MIHVEWGLKAADSPPASCSGHPGRITPSRAAEEAAAGREFPLGSTVWDKVQPLGAQARRALLQGARPAPGGGMERLASFSSKYHQINQLPHLGMSSLDGTRISWTGGILGSPSLKVFKNCANVALWGRGLVVTQMIQCDFCLISIYL